MHEIETKILEVDVADIKKKLADLGAEEIQNVRLTVDWFSLPDTNSDEHSWFLRVRSYSSGKTEVTWKGKSEILGASRSHKEINLIVDDHEKAKILFENIGLACYAHQEKDRISWKLENWQFDLDTYPNMPPYLEIEGNSEEHIQEMIKKLSLESHESLPEGERTLIERKYKLNWCDMRF